MKVTKTIAGAVAGLVVSSLAMRARGEEKMSQLETTLAAEGTPSLAHGVSLRLTVANHTRTPLRFCRYHTPFEGVRNHYIEVIDASGKIVEYRGMMAKRAPPTEKDWQSVAPGTSQHATFDLRDGYALAAGGYTVRFLGGAVSGLPSSPPITVTVAP